MKRALYLCKAIKKNKYKYLITYKIFFGYIIVFLHIKLKRNLKCTLSMYAINYSLFGSSKICIGIHPSAKCKSYFPG